MAALLSVLAPGAGHLYAGARRVGGILLLLSGAAGLALVVLVATRPLDVVLSLASRPLVTVVLAVDCALLALRLFGVVDSWRRFPATASAVPIAGLAAAIALAAAPHVAGAYVVLRSHDVLEGVFAADEPTDVLPAHGVFVATRALPEPRRLPRARRPRKRERLPVGKPLAASRRVVADQPARSQHPWVTILLIGSDHGPGNVGDRTDSMILAALQRGTRRAIAFGVPRNLVEVRLGGRAARALARFHEPLNALYAYARTRPELFPGGRDPGATALKQTISRLLGLRIDYYAFVNLDGFVDMVDALGGVTIHVKERLVDSVTQPTRGETKPTIDVYPGRTYHFYGREALAYVRSRKASSDYRRMARQRCFLSALAHQVNARDVLLHFRSLARTVEGSVRTDIPLDRLPDLVRLATGLDRRQTFTKTFGREYIARRRPSDLYPIPAVWKIRAAAREVMLHPDEARKQGQIASVAESC